MFKDLAIGYKVPTLFLSGSEGQFGNVGVTRCTKKKTNIWKFRGHETECLSSWLISKLCPTAQPQMIHCTTCTKMRGKSHTWTHTWDIWNRKALKVSHIFAQYTFWWFLMRDNIIFCILVMLLSTVCSVIMVIYRLSMFTCVFPHLASPHPSLKLPTAVPCWLAVIFQRMELGLEGGGGGVLAHVMERERERHRRRDLQTG